MKEARWVKGRIGVEEEGFRDAGEGVGVQGCRDEAGGAGMRLGEVMRRGTSRGGGLRPLPGLRSAFS